MRRRELILGLGGAIVAPTRGRAAESGKLFRVGIVSTVNPRSAPQFVAFEDRLREIGDVDGQNLAIEFVTLGGELERYPAAMRQMVDRGVDLIVAPGPEQALQAASAATSRIPIVMIAVDYDPVDKHLVASLARPGGNITGVFMQRIELSPKRLQLFKQAVPAMTRLVALWDASSVDYLKPAEATTRMLGLSFVPIEMRTLPYDYEGALAHANGARGDGLFLLASPQFFYDRSKISELALRQLMPSMSSDRELVEAGGLMSYGTRLSVIFRRAADYVDRILKGAKPADLPIEQPTEFDLVINLKTAKALGLTIPPLLLAQAEVIE
jgi:putative ABC transport system substrate-binding protein